jgi:hypothetical protein
MARPFKLIPALAEKTQLPAIYPFTMFVKTGGVMSYGIDIQALGHRIADMADQILKGAKPSDIKIFQPTKSELATISRQRKRSASPCRLNYSCRNGRHPVRLAAQIDAGIPGEHVRFGDVIDRAWAVPGHASCRPRARVLLGPIEVRMIGIERLSSIASATRGFALAMMSPVKYTAGKQISNQANYADIILSVIRQATFIPHPRIMPCTMRERGRERGPLDGSLRSRPNLTFFHAFAALSRNITEFTAVLGAPAASTVQKGAAYA